MGRIKTTLRGLAVAIVLAACLPAPHSHADGWFITAYLPTGSVMYSGELPFSGAAACSRRWAIGTRFLMWDGAIYTCLDRGDLDSFGVSLDLFAWNYAEAVYLMSRYNGTNPVVLAD